MFWFWINRRVCTIINIFHLISCAWLSKYKIHSRAYLGRIPNKFFHGTPLKKGIIRGFFAILLGNQKVAWSLSAIFGGPNFSGSQGQSGLQFSKKNNKTIARPTQIPVRLGFWKRNKLFDFELSFSVHNYKKQIRGKRLNPDFQYGPTHLKGKWGRKKKKKKNLWQSSKFKYQRIQKPNWTCLKKRLNCPISLPRKLKAGQYGWFFPKIGGTP